MVGMRHLLCLFVARFVPVFTIVPPLCQSLCYTSANFELFNFTCSVSLLGFCTFGRLTLAFGRVLAFAGFGYI